MESRHARQPGSLSLGVPAVMSFRAATPDVPPWLPGQVRGVLFDMGNVLYDDTLWRRWVVGLLARLGLRTSYRAFLHVWDRDYLDDVHRGRRTFCEALDAFLLSVGLTPSQIDEVEAACRGRRRQIETDLRLLPGVKSTIERLFDAGFAVGAINNSQFPAAVLRERLERFGVAQWFSAVVSSLDLKRAMPDAVGYLTATKEMNLPPRRVAFVGHDTAELAGAQAVNMPAIAFNFDSDARADVFLARFDGLLDILSPQRPLSAAG